MGLAQIGIELTFGQQKGLYKLYDLQQPIRVLYFPIAALCSNFFMSLIPGANLINRLQSCSYRIQISQISNHYYSVVNLIIYDLENCQYYASRVVIQIQSFIKLATGVVNYDRRVLYKIGHSLRQRSLRTCTTFSHLSK